MLMRIAYGEGDFANNQQKGKFKVAHKEIFVGPNAVSVFYPTHDEGEMYWMRYRANHEFTTNIQLALAWWK